MEQNYAFVPLDVLTETVTTVSETLSQLQLTVRKSAGKSTNTSKP